jgi:predicted O-methyltransferase YrrM
MSKIGYADKLLPNQEYFSNLYRGHEPYVQALFHMTSAFARDFRAEQFQLTTPKAIAFEEMSTPPSQLAMFNAIIKLTGAKSILEIGTFIGHTAMQFSKMAGKNAHITTIEIGKEFADIARENFRRNGFEERITLLEGSAGELLTNLPKRSFDLIFVDGSKQDYLDYTLKAEGLLAERGVIVVDDVFFHGDALNAEPSSEKGLGCKRLLEHYRDNKGFTKLLLPMSNGILILFRAQD